MQEIKNDQAFRQAIGQGRVMVEFYATWCPDCTRVEPHFPEWESKYREDFTLVRANRDLLPEVAEELQVLGIPSFIAFDDGEEVNRLYSRDAKSKAQVESYLDVAYDANK